MYCQVNARNETLLFCLCFDDIGSDRSDFIDEMSIVPKNIPEYLGHGESDVLPACLRQSVFGILHPNVGGLFATRSTESTFA